MNLIKNINIALAFLLELFSIVTLGYWGFTLPINKIIRTIVGILAPTFVIIIWGIWCAPSSGHRLEGIGLILLKCLLFALVTLCLVHTKHTFTASVFVVLVVVNLGLSAYFGTL